MPTYEYACRNCGHEMEVFQRMSDDALEHCPACDTSSLKRKIGRGAGIIFKGGGFYETDFKDRKGEKPDASAKPTQAESPTGSGAADTAAKPEKKEASPSKPEA